MSSPAWRGVWAICGWPQSHAATNIEGEPWADDGKGTLYVSDSKGKKVFAVNGDKATVHLDETVLKGPNGVLVHEGKLYVLDNNSLNLVNADKSLMVLADGMPGGADGLEHVKGGDFIVSVWSGAVWYVKADGNKELLFEGKAVQTSTADIAWDPATSTVYVPTGLVHCGFA